jgi:predicted secreted protein
MVWLTGDGRWRVAVEPPEVTTGTELSEAGT